MARTKTTKTSCRRATNGKAAPPPHPDHPSLGCNKWGVTETDKYMLFDFRIQDQDGRARQGAPRSPRAASGPQHHTPSSAPRCGPRSPRVTRPPWSAWAATGARAHVLERPASTTAVGYAGGFTPNPTYEEVCTGQDRPHRGGPGGVRPREDLVRGSAEGASGRTTTRPRPCARATTWAPSTARRSTPPTPEQAEIAAATKETFEERLKAAGYGPIATEIAPLDTFYYESDDVHQQYLAKSAERLLRPRGHGRPAARSASTPR